MEIFVCDNYEEMSFKVAREISRQLTVKPTSVLGLATGETPKGMYRKLVKMYKQKIVDFSEAKTFNLDEFYPIKRDNKHSFKNYMQKRLFEEVNLRPKNCFIPDGEAENPNKECQRYEKELSHSGQIDLQVLGIGENGHIGFNEPGVEWSSVTQLVELEDKTVKKEFNTTSGVPNKAITMGVKDIMGANRIVLLASGEGKKNVVERALKGPITQEVPASILQLHPKVKVYLDKEAA